MLISRVPDETGVEGRGEPDAAEEISRNFQTASELFELMTKDHDFEAGDDALTTRDLVLLYKNIDLGKQLMSNVHEFKRQTPNQYVEDVIYHDEGETDSDFSETYSNDDLHNIMLANKERIDLLTNKPSLDSLCHKLGDLEIQVSNISTNYDRRFMFKDPYINEQLKSLQLMSKTNELDTTMLPTSLLDYICCKRLEDNYNFYMDNIITYVKHTIEHLKRISNGDYLPDRVKEKWKEVEHARDENDTSKVLTTSTSIPLQVEMKVTGLSTTWDEIVHSEVDLRSLVKILEKKIVLEVPKVICGSYKLFSKYRAENLVISCKRKKREPEREESRVDVVVQLQRSNTGQVLGNIDSIMILKPQQQIAYKDCTNILPLTYHTAEQPEKLSAKVIELSEIESLSENKTSIESNELVSSDSLTDYKGDDYESKDSLNSNVMKPGSPTSVAQILNSVSRVIRAEAAANHATPNELNFSMINLNRQTSLPENSMDSTQTRKKSPTKVRIKSPYENKSAILEERKRKRLLEVKERRERRKKAMEDNNKVSKHKVLPQAVSSVTKLSITNKAFYNSIYGRNFDDKRLSTTSFCKVKECKEKQDKGGVIHEMEQESEWEFVDRENVSPKHLEIVNKPHFLDDAETEISVLQRKMDDGLLRISTSTSAVSNESANIFTQFDCCPSLTSLGVTGECSSIAQEKQRSEPKAEMQKTQSELNRVPVNSPKSDSEKVKSAVECRRSLEKIYTLMKKLREIESNETSSKKNTSVSNETRGPFSSESGTSLNHRLSYTNPSCTSFEKPDDQEINKEGDQSARLTPVVPKVVISTKPPTRTKTDETKKDRKTKAPRIRTIPENPLRAISQLLHDFDNVQKSRQKIVDPNSINRSMSTDARSFPRSELQKRRSRIQTVPAKEDPLSKVTAKVKTRFVSREEMRPEVAKTHILDKKNINDLIDEVKEARGEAVRGPAKFSSRLNVLAQPKRAYVQALNEEFPRRQTPERAPKEATHASRPRRRDVHSSPVSVKPPHSLESTGRPRRSAASSPESRVWEPPQFAIHAAAPTNTIRPTIKKKVAAEQPAGIHSGRVMERLETTHAPLLPSDWELPSRVSSPEGDIGAQASSIGSKLHHMVESILRAERPSRRPRSAASRVSPDRLLEEHIPTVLEEHAPDKHIRNERRGKQQFETCNLVTPVNSVTELEMLETALHRRLSSGSFPGRLRIKKLTLTPKPSLQHIAMHQSGDTTSIVRKSHTSQKITTTKSDERKMDLMALLSTTRMTCELYGFPSQISTVGYAFPVTRGDMKKIKPKIFGKGLLEMAGKGMRSMVSGKMSRSTTLLQITDKEEMTCRHFVGQPRSAGAECGVQASGFDITHATAPNLGTRRKNVETSTIEEPTIISASSAAVGTADESLADGVGEEKYELSEYTTSLNILVGLLNEIQNITTSAGDAQIMDISLREPSTTEMSGAAPAGPGAALDVHDELEIGDSLPSFMSKADVSDREDIIMPLTKSVGVGVEVECKPVYEDKEVWVRIPPPQQHAVVNTDPEPAHEQRPHLSPHETGTCTINIPKSTCSMSTITKSQNNDVSSNTSSKSDDTERTGKNRNSVKSLVPYYDNMFKVEKARRQAAVTCDKMSQSKKKSSNNTQSSNTDRGRCESLNKRDGIQIQNETVVRNDGLRTGGFESSHKMKRDVLVTFYSILVLTVFAALAFPDMQFLQQV